MMRFWWELEETERMPRWRMMQAPGKQTTRCATVTWLEEEGKKGVWQIILHVGMLNITSTMFFSRGNFKTVMQRTRKEYLRLSAASRLTGTHW